MYKSKWAVQEETAQHGQTTSPAVKATPPPTETPASKTVDEPVKPEQTSDPVPSTQQPLEPEAAYSQPTPEPEVQQTAETGFQTAPAYDPYMDEFAQTREDDLLFDDDIVPISEPQQVQGDVAEPASEPQPPAESTAPAIPTAPATRGRGGVRGKGRGGRRGGAHNATGASEDPETVPAEGEPATQTPRKEASVRGDRTGTGGVKKAKLTEEELAARMEAIRLKNASLTAAHAKAEADAASFEAREAAAAQRNQELRKKLAERQKQERLARSAMMVDREKNRQRKLDALGGREWDNEKEDGFSGTGEERRSGARRGAHGGVVGGIGRGSNDSPVAANDGAIEENYIDSSPRGRRGNRSRARGGRGGRGGRGAHNGLDHTQDDQAPPTAADFPDLPSSSAPKDQQQASAGAPPPLTFPNKPKPKVEEAEASKDDDGAKPPLRKQDSYGMPMSPADQKRSWADQVEGTL